MALGKIRSMVIGHPYYYNNLVWSVKGHASIVNAIDGVGGKAMSSSSDVGTPEIVSGSRDGSVKVVKHYYVLLIFLNSLRLLPCLCVVAYYVQSLTALGRSGKREASGMHGANRRWSQT